MKIYALQRYLHYVVLPSITGLYLEIIITQNMFFETVGFTAGVMILAELADKTSLLTMSIASKSSKPFTVGSAALIG